MQRSDLIAAKAREVVHSIIGATPAHERLVAVSIKEDVRKFFTVMGQEEWYTRAFSEGGWLYLCSLVIRSVEAEEAGE